MSTEIVTVRDKRKNIYRIFNDIYEALRWCEMTGRSKVMFNDRHPLDRIPDKRAANFFVWEFEKNGESMQHYLKVQKKYNQQNI